MGRGYNAGTLRKEVGTIIQRKEQGLGRGYNTGRGYNLGTLYRKSGAITWVHCTGGAGKGPHNTGMKRVGKGGWWVRQCGVTERVAK